MKTRTLRTAPFEVGLPASLRHLGRTTMGTLTGEADRPLVLVLGGISANRFVCQDEKGEAGWWPGMVGHGCAVDPARYQVMGLDFAADGSGRTAPSTEDQAGVIRAALDMLGVARLDAIVGASYGGMVALKFGQLFPGRVAKLVAISACAEPHAAATAQRDLQRRIVALGLANGCADQALSIARGLAMMSYRTPEEFAQRFIGGLSHGDPLGLSDPGRYLAARGSAFQAVMSPERFLSLSASIDRHKVEPAEIPVPVLLIGATSDQLVPPSQMLDLAKRLPCGQLHLLDCLYGHDMFLKEAEKMGELVAPFLEAS